MLILLIIVAILWAYSAVVLALVAGRTRYVDTDGQVPLNDALKAAAVIVILCPLLVYAAHIDWYEESEG